MRHGERSGTMRHGDTETQRNHIQNLCVSVSLCLFVPGLSQRLFVRGLSLRLRLPVLLLCVSLVSSSCALGPVRGLAATGRTVIAVPAYAVQQLDRTAQAIVRRRAPAGHRRAGLAFARTELFFGTAKREGAVTPDEFRRFLDDVVTPLFPDGLTVTRVDGQFRGEDGVTIKEDAYVLVLMYPAEGLKASSANIDLIRRIYMRQHQQESVLRADDPYLVWVSF
jgi:hypothetical protein